jgi:hypothetical protein
VTKLLLFSDAAQKTRLDKLEELLFTYDFTDLASAANVVSGIQSRLKDAMETQQIAESSRNRRLQEEEGKIELLKLKAHIFLLTEELNLLFDAIKLAQDRLDDRTDQKSALLLHTSSSEISWHMLDDRRDLLSKLVVQEIDFHWLNRQDSSTGNNLTVGNLQAFDGSRHALWAEILSKYDEPLSHPLVKVRHYTNTYQPVLFHSCREDCSFWLAGLSCLLLAASPYMNHLSCLCILCDYRSMLGWEPELWNTSGRREGSDIPLPSTSEPKTWRMYWKYHLQVHIGPRLILHEDCTDPGAPVKVNYCRLRGGLGLHDHLLI